MKSSSEEVITDYLNDILQDKSLGTVFIGRSSSGAPIGFCIVYLMPSTFEATRNPAILDLFIREEHARKRIRKATLRSLHPLG